MKALYLINLFIVSCSSFIIQPSYLPMKYSNINNYPNNNNQLKLRKPLIHNLKKNNNDNNNNNNNDNNDYDDIKRFQITLIYNIILYTFIFGHLFKDTNINDNIK
jgi:hypothetical protein